MSVNIQSWLSTSLSDMLKASTLTACAGSGLGGRGSGLGVLGGGHGCGHCDGGGGDHKEIGGDGSSWSVFP